jgi:hypothetical protein
LLPKDLVTLRMVTLDMVSLLNQMVNSPLVRRLNS